MKSSAIRLYIVVALIVVTFGLTQWAGWATEPPVVELPPWSLSDLPLQLGSWRGETTKTDPEIFAASDANVIVDRRYVDDENHVVLSHTATFPDPEKGIYHNPLNCYRTHGWTKLRDTTVNLDVSDNLTIPVVLTVWENENKKVMVFYWYQLGERILHERWELGKARFAMRGHDKWPVLLKVMLQTDVTERDDPEEVLMGFGKQIAGWLNNPEHSKYFERWRGV